MAKKWKQHWNRKQLLCIALLAGLILTLTGCTMPGSGETKREQVDFTVVNEERLPEELAQLLEGKKTEPFKLTYTDGSFLYLCIGYGEQETGGYSVSVKELSRAEGMVYVNTLLVGPETVPEEGSAPSYPMIVLKIENRDEQINFL